MHSYNPLLETVSVSSLQVSISCKQALSLFRNVYIENSLGRQSLLLEQEADLFTVQYSKDNVPFQGKGQADLLPFIKDLGSLSLRFLSSVTDLTMCTASIWTSQCHPL